MTESIRIEHDSLGTIKVPMDALWGAQTQRSLLNFSIGGDQVPIELIHALAKVKQASAIANNRLGKLEERKRDLIVNAATEISNGLHDQHFPLKVWQTGSGTQTNMNMNEVICNLASLANGEELGSQKPLHPNDDVNCSQSTNDTFPAAIHIAAAEALEHKLLSETKKLVEAFTRKSKEWDRIIKLGRTHLQDAVPLTLGQECSAWRDQIVIARERIITALDEIYPLQLGGTAIGTGLNAPANFDVEVTSEISLLTGLPFSSASNKFAIMASHDGLVNMMSQIKLLSVSLLKIVNDLRLLACGPRAGFSELKLPENEPGSSIMPGKINPTQCEAMAMVCTQIIGLDVSVSMAGSGGHLQMNVYKPLIGMNLLNSIRLINDACRSCRKLMIEGMQANKSKIDQELEQSLMLVTALAPKIGYTNASKIAKVAYQENLTLREASNKLGFISEEDFSKFTNTKLMVNNNQYEEL